MATSGDAEAKQMADPRSMTHTTSSNVQLEQDTYAAFGRDDIDAVVAAMHPDIEWHEAEHSPWHAPGAVRSHRGSPRSRCSLRSARPERSIGCGVPRPDQLEPRLPGGDRRRP